MTNKLVTKYKYLSLVKHVLGEVTIQSYIKKESPKSLRSVVLAEAGEDWDSSLEALSVAESVLC